MAAQADVVYKDRDTIVAELIASWQARIPDIQVTPDSIIRIWIEVAAEAIESLMLANQLLHDDMFVQTASGPALIRYGDLYGRPIKQGTPSLGSVRFSGAPGVVVPLGTLVSAPQAGDDALGFVTTAQVTIPNVGVAAAPLTADGGAGALAAGLYEYAVSFQSALGESTIGAISAPLTLAATRQVAVTSIPIGGPGTTGRRIYRRVNGGAFALVTTIPNNTTTTFTDNVTSLGGAPLTDSTAEQVDATAASEDVGLTYNTLINTITVVSDSAPGVAAVTNPVSFTGGSDPEDIETFRLALLDFVRNPQSGSATDLETWAESVAGVESATAFANDNLGTAAPGHATVRITGPGGTIPSAQVQADVLAELQAQDIINITLHVGVFSANSINVSVSVTLASGYVLADVTSAVQQAIADYITSIPVGGTVYIAGIIDAVFGLPGIATLTVTTPASNVTSTSTQKPTPGTITVA